MFYFLLLDSILFIDMIYSQLRVTCYHQIFYSHLERKNHSLYKFFMFIFVIGKCEFQSNGMWIGTILKNFKNYTNSISILRTRTIKWHFPKTLEIIFFNLLKRVYFLCNKNSIISNPVINIIFHCFIFVLLKWYGISILSRNLDHYPIFIRKHYAISIIHDIPSN